ncbi:MAG: RNA polymerase sigma factor [Chloroflexi bacterium]|nr:RNA polymerase sigma factor [Chloroflexota bacterium]
MPVVDDHHAALEVLFDAMYDRVLAYARRRTAQLADAEDAVAETYLVVWRLMDRLPAATPERLPWLLGIARRVIANQRRSASRRAGLLRKVEASADATPPMRALGQSPVLAAMEHLGDTDREILRLVAWEGLSHSEVGIALGITANAAAIRLYRARTRLRAELSERPKGSGPSRTLLRWRGSKVRRPGQEEAQ